MASFLDLGWRKVYDGFAKIWKTPPTAEHGGFEVVESSDSVALLVFDRTRRELIFVEQERLPVISAKNSSKIVEVLAGRFDITIGVRGLMVKEAKEELGLNINEDDIDILNQGGPLFLSPGILTEKMYLGFVEVSCFQFDDGETFGVDPGEETRRVRVPIGSIDSYNFMDMKTFALVQWFLANKLQK